MTGFFCHYSMVSCKLKHRISHQKTAPDRGEIPSAARGLSSFLGRIVDVGHEPETVTVAGRLAGDAVEIVHMAVADAHIPIRAAGELMVVALVSVGAESHLVYVAAVAGLDGLAGYRGQTVVVRFLAVHAYAALNLVQMQLNGTVVLMLIFHFSHPMQNLRSHALHTMRRQSPWFHCRHVQRKNSCMVPAIGFSQLVTSMWKKHPKNVESLLFFRYHIY